MSGMVYILCAATSFLCAVLLLRSYWKTRVRLLLWSGLCFVGLTLDNALLYVDLVVLPDVPLGTWRRLPGFVSISLLIFGLVWEEK